ncbi:hypothetical protein B9Z19DRAFT_1062367 [Tuber borchii]|uniref:Uncharacterized protein n=1 Tax=Tuber borchii TaxID=42251 RepID=A0A2T7A227_TUBBO|nr:hypothetical protein B9Z19DRAFT_1062367 [Tuber borchii]
MSIRTVPGCPPRIVSLPWTASQWKKTIKNIVPMTDIGGLNLNWHEEEALLLEQTFDDPSQHPVHTHAECALIEYLRMEYEEHKRHRSTLHKESASHKKRKCGERERSREPVGVSNDFMEVGSRKERGGYIGGGGRVVGLEVGGGRGATSDSLQKNLESGSEVYSKAGKKVESWRTTERDSFTSKRSREEMENQPESKGWEMVPAFSYIGVSKLCCAACKMWIEGYNQQEGPEFYTRGSHVKWYWPWGLPQLNEDVLSKYMVKKITSAYRQHCRANGRLKNLSDGSTAATTAPVSPDSIDQLVFESLS